MRLRAMLIAGGCVLAGGLASVAASTAGTLPVTSSTTSSTVDAGSTSTSTVTSVTTTSPGTSASTTPGTSTSTTTPATTTPATTTPATEVSTSTSAASAAAPETTTSATATSTGTTPTGTTTSSGTTTSATTTAGTTTPTAGTPTTKTSTTKTSGATAACRTRRARKRRRKTDCAAARSKHRRAKPRAHHAASTQSGTSATSAATTGTAPGSTSSAASSAGSDVGAGSASASGASASGASASGASASGASASGWASLSASNDGLATAQDIALSRLSGILAAGDRPPAYLIPIYKAAGRRYRIPWTILAAINAVETDYGRNLSISSAGAEGWMQFMPGTWARYGATAAGTSKADPYNPRDAIFAAARLLAANGGRRHLRRAVFAYNHATWYVDEVLWLSEQLGGEEHASRGAQAKIKLMLSTAEMLRGLPYVWGGGHGGWTFADGYDCSGFVSAVLHAAGYLHIPATTQTLPDETGIATGPGRWVTIFDRTDGGSTDEDHVIIDIDGRWWESGGSTGSGGSASVHRIRSVSATYLQTFNLILHPRSL